MAKKSLTDLLREEVEKSPELEGEKVQEMTTVEKSQMNKSPNPNIRRSSPTKADLEATITELKAALDKAEKKAKDKEKTFADLKDALEEAHKKEETLQQQIADLQSDLQQQQESVQKLQKELEKIAHLKTDFKQAKNAAVQLAEANEKLTQEIKALKKDNEGFIVQDHSIPAQKSGRPIQKETERPVDFATKSWLL
jgi:uncharacterized phage infection (PIP) family protein YhgE